MKKKLVVLTGAGVSAESGLKTFRDSDGLWEGWDVYEVATPGAFKRNPQLVLDFYNMRRRDVAAAQPNDAHKVLAELEDKFDVTIVTQNIDDLHERGGSTKVLHLHGEIFKMRSVTDESLVYSIEGDINVGDYAEDGGQLRPHIVWFEELVPMMEVAVEEFKKADILVIIGTSLLVYPAAGLVNYAPWQIPKFLIDKALPDTRSLYNLTVIQKPASEGVKDLQQMLTKLM